MFDIKRYLDDTEIKVLNDWSTRFSSAETYVVGGTVRDILLDKQTSDIDIAIKPIPFDQIEAFADEHNLKAIWLDEAHGILRILPRDNTWHLDVAYYQGTIEEDMERRDFTVNAMAIPLKGFLKGRNETILDIFNGQKDLKSKKLLAVSDTAFSDDPIRILRGIRLSGTLGFTISILAKKQIQRDAVHLKECAGERIREELLVILGLPDSSHYFEEMLKLKVIENIFPEMMPTLTTDQPDEQQWNVFIHSIKSMDAFDFLLRKGEWKHADKSVLDAVPWNDEIADHFTESVNYGSSRRHIVKLAAFLHDISKPETRVVTPEGKIRFYGHPQIGAGVAKEIMKRLRFSTRETDIVVKIVEHHLHPVQLSQVRPVEGKEFTPPSKKALFRYCRDLGDEALDVAYFSLADDLAAFGDGLNLTNWVWHGNITNCIVNELDQLAKSPMPKLLDGDDLIRLGIPKGPAVGDILEKILTLQAEGTIVGRDDALEYVNKIIEQGQNETKV